MNLKNLEIDWDSVKKALLKKERILPSPRDDRARAISDSFDECLAQAKSLVRPDGIAAAKKIVKHTPRSIELDGGAVFSSKKIASYMRGATHFVLFLVTIGEGVEKAATAWLSSNEPLRGYLLDRIGSFAVESLAIAAEYKIQELYTTGHHKSVSVRFSPGYCDWPVEEQFVMARVLDFSEAGVALTEGCMMVPRKSISAIVAIGEPGLFTKKSIPCQSCAQKDCDYRRV